MRKIVIFTTLFLFATVSIFGQSSQWYISHPVKPQKGQPRILADTVKIKHGWGGEALNLQSSTVIKRSNDGLRDTLYTDGIINNLEHITVYEYDTDNRLINVRDSSDNVNSFYLSEEYEYDSFGRQTKESEWSIPGIFINYDYSTFVQTDSGYFLNQMEYVFDSEDRLIRAGEKTYSYFEDGFVEFDPQRSNTMYYLSENGYRLKRIVYQGTLEQLAHAEIWETEYLYKADNPNNPSSNTSIENRLRKVYSTDGAVIVHSDIPETTRIFSVSGILVRTIQTVPGIQSIPLPKGFYFILTGDKAYKVMVR